MTRAARLGRPASALVVATVVALLPWMGLGMYWERQFILVMILALVVSGLNTTLGYAGELAVNQVALYAAGAYVAGYLSVYHGVHDIGLCLLAAIGAAVLIGLVSGIPGLKLGGWTLAMLTFFLVLIIPNVLDLLPSQTGGVNGLVGIPSPTFAGLHLNISGRSFYLFVAVITSLWFIILRNLILSPHGDAFLLLKQSPILASSMGMSVYRLKLLAYVVGAVPAGIAGVLFAFLSQFISPASFTLSFAFSILVASILGGSQSIYGALLGAAVVQLGTMQIYQFQNWSEIIYGAFFIVAALVFSEGVIGMIRVASRRLPRSVCTLLSFRGPQPELAGLAPELPSLEGETLRVEEVSKAFGGVRALSDVSLDAAPGEVTALIGPNGSGKTTLLNLICGYYRPASGEIWLGQRRVDSLNPHRTARAGVARTFQTPLVPKGMPTRVFVTCGAFVSRGPRIVTAVVRSPAFRRRLRELESEAQGIMEMLGIGEQADVDVDALPLGTRRLAEVARCLIARPRLFLFDEVGSGLDEGDLDRLEAAIALIRRAGGTIILVEHNFSLVLKNADKIHVLSKGVLLVSGSPQQIQEDPRVLEEYVGGREAVQTAPVLAGISDNVGSIVNPSASSYGRAL